MIFYGYSDNPTIKIIYWYDHNIKSYTFQYLDIDGNQTRQCDYCVKNNLITNKNAIQDEYGIMPTIWRE